LKETRPLWPPQRGVGLREPNLGKTNPCVTLFICLRFVFAPSLADSFIFLTLTRLVVIFVNFSFALFTPPLGDYHRRRRLARQPTRCCLLLGLGCPASSSVGGGEGGVSSNVVLPPRGEDVVDSVAGGRAIGRHCRCRTVGEGVSCRSCRRGT
jgi:hypothetical protein